MICEDVPIHLDIRRLSLAGMSGLWVDTTLVRITTTPCTFGGERRWFLCPKCDRRCAVLYRGLRCRLCIKARYRIERMSPLDRMTEKASKLRRKLGQNDPVPADPIPNKPPRMRWHTYLRIRAEIRRLELEVVMQLNARLMLRA